MAGDKLAQPSDNNIVPMGIIGVSVGLIVVGLVGKKLSLGIAPISESNPKSDNIWESF